MDVGLAIANATQSRSGTTINFRVNVKIQMNIMCAREYISNPAASTCKNGKYLVSHINNSVSRCVEIINTANSAANVTTVLLLCL